MRISSPACFPVWALTNNAAISLHVQICVVFVRTYGFISVGSNCGFSLKDSAREFYLAYVILNCFLQQT